MFHSARIKLTIWYLIIAGLISATFSISLYGMISKEIERFEQMSRLRIERRITEQFLPHSLDQIPQLPDILHAATPEILEEAHRRILIILVSVNGIVILLSGTLGYFLAGRTLQPIADMVSSQQRFISDASHELKTPLTSLKSAFEVFLRGSDKTLKEAEIIILESIDEVNKLQKLSESLLTLTTFQSSQSMVFQTISLSDCIQDAIKTIEPKAKLRDIIITNSKQDISIKGDKKRLSNLFVILFDNAIKYGKEHGKLQITVKKKREIVVISVKDDGIGIDTKDIPLIFDRFYRADSARTNTNEKSYGLGLSIAKEIVTLHKGSIDVISAPDKGTEFIIKLPFI
jgi:two-component system, OmpR family, sensor histidine kinase CiaH